MEWHNHLYYTKISNYEDYKNFNNLSTLINLTEEDFKNKFLVITSIENTSMTDLTLSELYKEKDTLYIGLDKVPYKENFNNTNNSIIITIDNSLKTSQIEVFKTIQDRDNFSNKFQDIKDLPEDYSKEQAQLDGCVINGENNTEILSKFLENVNNGISDGVRFYNLDGFDNELTSIVDLTYLSDKNIFIVCNNTRNDSTYTYNYYEYDTLNKLSSDSSNIVHKYPNRYELTNSKKSEESFFFSL